MRWACSVCGEEHEGLPLDWSYDSPSYWEGPRHEEDVLTADICSWTDDVGERSYFIRGVLHVPVPELNDSLRYGIWSSLSQQSFDRVLELWDAPARTEEPPYFGWLSNSLPGYPETLNLKTDVVTADLDLRPRIVLHDGDHPMIREQQEGITVDRLLDLVGPRLHEIALDR
ncbi:MAG: DUF2199 domain-containing protein [Actinobacteria bacterium]|nr:DUF2199 domain-containing protein [Actinomycetota bacterium]